MNGSRWMIYGANGYTGRLVAARAVERGERPVLAGRNAAAVEALAAELGLPWRSFPLTDPGSARAHLVDLDAVLHCAGPFVHTSRPMVDACLAAGTHYLDVTGEIPVFESVLGRGEAARRARAALLPGVGFDVVPTDCLAARLAAALPGADRLELAFYSARGGYSPGTLKTMIEALPHGAAERRDGRIVPLAPAEIVREIDFSCGRRTAMAIGWGDVSTAFYTTGIPNVRVYAAAPPAAIRRLRRLRPLMPLAGTAPVKRLLAAWVDRRVHGPDALDRERGRTYLWGRAATAEGDAVSATLDVPEGYTFTAASAVESVVRVLAGAVEPGAWTPAAAFGAGFVTELPGVEQGELVRSHDPDGEPDSL
jgi:saccharopine dehydrogenase (NAD+, L-lysine-forming)